MWKEFWEPMIIFGPLIFGIVWPLFYMLLFKW